MWAKDPDVYSQRRHQRRLRRHEARVRAAGRPPEGAHRARDDRCRPRSPRRAKNLDNPPRIYTEIAIEQIDGNIDFFRNDVAGRIRRGERRRRSLADFKATNDGVIAALGDVQDVAPEGPAAEVERQLRDRRRHLPQGARRQRDDRRAARSAARASPRRTGRRTRRRSRRRPRRSTRPNRPTQVLASLQADHPPAEQAAEGDAGRRSTRSRQFIADHHIVTMPAVAAGHGAGDAAVHALDDVGVDGHARAVRDRRSSQAFYNMTLPDPRWTAAEQADVHAAVVLRRDLATCRCTRSTRATTCSSSTRSSSRRDVRKVYGAEHQRRRLGALLRADDARRRVPRRRPEVPAGAAPGRAAARRRGSSSASSCTRRA